MTEAEWLACEKPTPMMDWLRTRGSERQFYLAGVAAVRQVDHLLTGQRYRDLLLLIERYADGLVWKQDLERAQREAEASAFNEFMELLRQGRSQSQAGKSTAASRAAAFAAMTNGAWQAGVSAMQEATSAGKRKEIWPRQCAMLRDIFGNPFRPLPPSALGSAPSSLTVQNLARVIYDGQIFEHLPILADALEEAGCHAPAVLEHCRGTGIHMRGCWVIDLVLGKK